jgi:hypothetical protein
LTNCTVCLSADGSLNSDPVDQLDRLRFDCSVCGCFVISRDLIEDFLSNGNNQATRRVRATLSHWIRLNQGKSSNPSLNADVYKDVIDGKISLPTPAQIALSILRYVGDYTQGTGEKLNSLPPSFSAEIGANSRKDAFDLLRELEARGQLNFSDDSIHGWYDASDIGLTLDGWEIYQSERTGGQTAGFGFLAMKFGEEPLENITQNHLKPAVKDLGYELVDMRDVALPGIVDNIMRMRIRDANFVIVDLTHDNPGAYWEAGYAEGLGKPVLYICDKDKFDEHGTHFDTNHCTTVMWKADEPDDFCERLVATLRRALPS